MDRREFLRGAVATAAAACLPSTARSEAAADAGIEVNDISGLNPVRVQRIATPRSSDELRAALAAGPRAVSIGGGRFSMGGQVAAPDSLHLDLRGLSRPIWLDVPARRVRMQAGATWRDLQELIDPHDLSVRIMQSYSNFTIGGSVSVNCHGRYVGLGPLINSVRAVQLVTATGDVLELSREHEPELFRAVFGGYGGLGVVSEVELDLAQNTRMQRSMIDVPLDDYPQYFHEHVATDATVVMHNADLTPPAFDRPCAVSWSITDKPLTIEERLIPRGLDYSLEKNAIWAITELPGGQVLRDSLSKRERGRDAPVVWRNREASLDAMSLEPRTRLISTYLLQEYFIPVAGFGAFARDLSRILRTHAVEALNVSIRHAPADRESLLSWAPHEVFSFVLYFKQRTDAASCERVTAWTRELIEAALKQQGCYYLPYRPDATLAQFARA